MLGRLWHEELRRQNYCTDKGAVLRICEGQYSTSPIFAVTETRAELGQSITMEVILNEDKKEI